MRDYLNKLKAKFNYSSELIDFLEKAIPSIIQYYGEEYQNIVLQTLLNCKIHIQSHNENSDEYLNNYFEKKKQWQIMLLGGAFYHKEITVSEGLVSSKTIIYIRTIYSNQYKPFDFNSDEKCDNLLHEILHAIKGYGKLKMQDNQIIDSTGLAKDIYYYDPLNGIKEERNEYHVGIEEAVNSLDTSIILSMILGRTQPIRAYNRAGTIASFLLQHKDIAEIIRSSQLKGDENWIRYLGDASKKGSSESFRMNDCSMYLVGHFVLLFIII